MRYGIIGAMPVEIEKIKQNMTIEKETVLMRFTSMRAAMRAVRSFW